MNKILITVFAIAAIIVSVSMANTSVIEAAPLSSTRPTTTFTSSGFRDWWKNIIARFKESHKTPTSTPITTSTAMPTASPIPSTNPVSSPTPTNGTSTSGGLGVGTGFGPEIGINLTKFNQIKADAVAHVYDRLCTAAEHDKTKWHSLVNVEAKCHYDHEHGDDPNFVNDIFGTPGAWFGNATQSISYPWQTFSLAPTTLQRDALTQYGVEGQKENDLKHPGYYWLVRRNQSCDGGVWCITDWRLQFHFMTSHFTEVPVRFHSFSFEGRLCKTPGDPATCGIYRTGGWTDHGQLFVPSVDQECWNALNADPIGGLIVNLPSDRQYYPLNSQGLTDEMRCHKKITDTIIKSLPNGYTSPVVEWWTHGAYDFRYAIRVFDPISNVDPSMPDHHSMANSFFCSPTDTSCRWNNSIMTGGLGYTTQIGEYYGGIPVDPNGDERTDFTLGKVYLNRFGDVNKSCTKAALDCIPLELSNILLTGKEQRYANRQCDSCAKLDHDITPAGIPSWINWYFNY